MQIDYLFAAVLVSDLEASISFYSKILGRQPDDRPLDWLVQWRGFSNAGIQLFKDASKAGKGRMTIIVPDLEATIAELGKLGIAPGDFKQGNFGKIAQLADPDGNLITFAEPPKT